MRPDPIGRVGGRLAYELAPPSTLRTAAERNAAIAWHAERVARDLARLGPKADMPPPGAPERPGHAAGPRAADIARRRHDYAAILAIFDEDPSRNYKTIATIYRFRAGIDVHRSLVRRLVRRERGEGPRLGSRRDNPKGGRGA